MVLSLESVLAIASFALSVGGLAHILIIPTLRRQVILAVVVAALVPTTGFALYRVQQHERRLTRMEAAIIKKLSHDTLTFEQVYEGLHYEEFATVNEAIFRLVARGALGQRVLEVRSADGTPLRLRVYYVQ